MGINETGEQGPRSEVDAASRERARRRADGHDACALDHDITAREGRPRSINHPGGAQHEGARGFGRLGPQKLPRAEEPREGKPCDL